MKFDKFIITGPQTLFRANVNGEYSPDAWQAISDDKQQGRELRTLVSVSIDSAFDALRDACNFGAHLLIDGEIINPNNYHEFLVERARNARTQADAAEALPPLAQIFADLVPYKMDAPVAEQQIRELMPERIITAEKTLQELAADYLHRAIEMFDRETCDLVQVRDNNPNVIIAPTDRAELRKMILEEGGVFAQNWPMGTGKTECNEKLLNECQAEERTAAMIAPRKTHHARHLGSAVHYETIKQTKKAGPVAYCTPNSLYLPDFEKYRTEATLLIVDEYEQNKAHCASKAVLNNTLTDRGLITNSTNNSIKSAAHQGAVVIADAQLSEYSVNELARMTGKKVILSLSDIPQRTRKLKLHKSHQSCVNDAQNLLSKGRRVVVFTDMAHSATRDDFGGLVLAMESIAGPDRVLRIDKDYVQNPDNAEALKNINGTVEAHDAVIISPAINSGFSITTDKVDAVFVLASGTVLPNEFVQTLGRFRAMDEIHASFEIRERWLPTNPTDVLNSLAGSEIMATGYSDSAIEHLRTQPGVEQVINQIARDNQMRQNYANRALIMARCAGFELERVAASENKSGGKTLNDGKYESEENRAKSLSNTTRIDEKQADKIRAKANKTREEETQLENFDMRVAYRTPDLSLDLIRADRNGWMRGIIKNWKTATKERTDYMTLSDMQRRRIIRKLFDCIDTNINTMKPNAPTAAQNLKAWAKEQKIEATHEFIGSLLTAPMGMSNQEDRPAFFIAKQADKFATWIMNGEMKISGHSIPNRTALKAFGLRISPKMKGANMVRKLLTQALGLGVEKQRNGAWKFEATADFEMCFAMATADVDPSEYKWGDEQAAQDADIDAQVKCLSNPSKEMQQLLIFDASAQEVARVEIANEAARGFVVELFSAAGFGAHDFGADESMNEQEKAKKEKLERMAAARPARTGEALDWSEGVREYHRQLERTDMQDAARARRNRKAKYKRKPNNEAEAA